MLKVYQKKIIDKIQKNRREEKRRFVRDIFFPHFIKVRATIVIKKLAKKNNSTKEKKFTDFFFVTKLITFKKLERKK